MRKTPLGLILIILLLSLLALLPLPWNEPVKDSFADLQFKLRGERRLSDEIVLVFIGAEDVQAMNGWPITRDYYGYMTHALSRLGAKVIGFDVLFDSPNRTYPEFDAILADFFQSASNVCLPMTFSELSREQSEADKINQHLGNMMIGREPVFPFKELSEHAAAIGFANFTSEPIVRKAPLVVASGDSFMLSFGVELARLYLNANHSPQITREAIVLTDVEDRTYSYSLEQQGRIRLNHFGGVDDVTAIGFVDLLKTFERAPDSLDCRGKIIIVAATFPGAPTLKATPLADALPAALIHATVAENLIHQNFLRDVSSPVQFALIVLMAISIWLVWQTNRSSSLMIVGSSGSLLLYWILAMTLFSKANLVLPLFYPTLAGVVTMSYAALMRSRQRRSVDDSMKELFEEQIVAREAQLEEAKTQLSEFQNVQQQQSKDSEQIKQLAAERENIILALEKELRDLRTHLVSEQPSEQKRFPEIIHAENSNMVHVLELVAKVGSENIPVLLLGETGTGKELIARAIHHSGKRKTAPFVAINCGALPETLLESELFGHEKGSFTGANARRRGRFELANGGTIFLDEITETTPAFQARLLRVLQEGTFERLGGEETIKVDVRVIAACNKDLQAEVKSERFRADLFYRLNGFPLTLPPLRERRDDVPLLATHFLKKHGYQAVAAFSDHAMEIMQTYHWPGNVRELENVVRRAAILAQSDGRKIIQHGDLPREISERESPQKAQVDYQSLDVQILEMLRALKFSRSAITQTAKALGNRDRGTITEYFRGLCFEHLVNANYDVDAAARALAATTDEQTVERVKAKLDEYLKSLRNFDVEGATSASIYKGLPKKYHSYLHQVIAHFLKK